MVVLLLALAALGADELGVDAQLFRPTAAGEPLLWTPTTTGGPGWAARAVFHHALDPLLFESATGERERILGGVTQLDLQGAWTYGRIRAAVDLPLALGFGVKDRADVDFLTGKVDIAVIGTQTIRVVEQHGIEAVGDFIRGLR